MIVCSCNVLSDGQIRACVAPGPGCPRTAADVYQCLGCSPKCGRCARTIRAIVANALSGAQDEIAVTACATDCAASCPLGRTHTHAGHHAHVDHAEVDHAEVDHAHVHHGHNDHGAQSAQMMAEA